MAASLDIDWGGYTSVSVKEMIAAFYLNERHSNVRFTFKNNKEKIPAHSLVLCGRSEVFARMFAFPGMERRMDGSYVSTFYVTFMFASFYSFYLKKENSLFYQLNE